MTIPGISHPAVPYGSTIVVTGASGFIESHVVDQALAAGYKVRATSQSAETDAWLVDHFNKKWGSGSVNIVEVVDMEAEGAFNDVVRGAAGFIHMAHDPRDPRDPAVHIPRTVNGALNALKAAAAEPGMRRFVYASSSLAVTHPKPNKQFTVTTDTFNEEVVERCKQPGVSSSTVFAASKVAAERAIEQWVRENKSSLVVNILISNQNFGPLINSAKQRYPASDRLVEALWFEDYDYLLDDLPQHYINVQDNARLHMIALANPTVQSERIFAVVGPVHQQEIVDILRKLHPYRQLDDSMNEDKDLSIFEPSKIAEALLLEAYGSGFIGLEESVKGNVQEMAKEPYIFGVQSKWMSR